MLGQEQPTPRAFVDVFRRLVRRIQPTRAIEPEAMGDYYTVLREFPMNIIAKAATELAREPRKFFPSTGEWLEAAKAIDLEGRLRRVEVPPCPVRVDAPPHVSSVGRPNTAGEWPYDPTETFSGEELQAALWWRERGQHATSTRHDACPHSPACPNVRVCLEEIAWYLRHRPEIHEHLR